MLPATLDLSVYRGDSIDLVIRLRALLDGSTLGDYIDLTGTTPRAQIRASESSTAVIATFQATLLDQVVTPGGIRLQVSPTVSSTLPVTGIPLRWDLELIHSSTNVRTYLRGGVDVTADVTR